MYNSNLATNPYGLAALLCVVSLAAGYYGFGRFKIAIFFGMLGYAAVILCQYIDCDNCHHTGKLVKQLKTYYRSIMLFA